MNFEVETLLTFFVIAAILTLIARLFGGWTLAGLLATFLLTCLGTVGGWVAQRRLGLPPLYAVPFPGDSTTVPIVWPTLGACFGALLGARLWQPRRRAQRARNRTV